MLLFQALSLLIPCAGFFQLPLGLFPGALGLCLIVVPGELAESVDLFLILLYPFLQLFDVTLIQGTVFFQLQIVATGLAGSG